jgi:hypothetical protein
MKHLLRNLKTPLITGLFFVLIGIAVWHFSFLQKQFFINNQKLLEFLSHALICVGCVAIILEIPDWRRYFGDRIKDIVMNHSYLNSLNDEQLALLQANLLQSKFKNSEIVRDGSFLDFMQINIQSHSNTSYRENVISKSDISETANGFLFREELSYIIKTMGDDSIKEIEWTWADNELKDKSFQVITKCPTNKFNSKNCKCKNKDKCIDGSQILTANKEKHDNGEIGYKLKLDEFIEVTDDILIKLKLEYIIEKNRLFFWSMIVPSKCVNLYISFPNDYKVDSFVGGLNKSDFLEEKNANSYSFTRTGWMLPRAGIAINIYKT